ncbi:MAG: di-heme oxidoredictase family protein [Longimicrobiales bacterium]
MSRRILPLLLLGVATGCADAPPMGTATPGEPVAGLTEAERGRFLLGRALFERLATQEEGLGPLFNGDRCSTCHDEPSSGGAGTRVLVLKATRFEGGRCSVLTDEGGDNIQQRSTPLLQAAGVSAEPVPAGATASVYVTAPPLYGLGLLEAVSEADLLAREDPDDADGDGISGRAPRRPDGTVARFGRKGDATSVRGFVVDALLQELGFTTEAHPNDLGPGGAALPDGVDPMPDPEMDPATVDVLTDYVRLLAPPAPEVAEGAAADSVEAGRRLFADVGCTGCHTPSLRTGPAPQAALADGTIAPYSDLLLHDLGGADRDVCTPWADPGEYRTPPLWGLRYRTRFLHDGSARSLGAALDAHGGEATRARAAFQALSPADQARLLRFLASL